jgi:hypothetical protein
MAKPKDKKSEDITEANLEISRGEENSAIDGAEAAFDRALTGARAGAMPVPTPARREGLEEQSPSLAEELEPNLRDKRRRA